MFGRNRLRGALTAFLDTCVESAFPRTLFAVGASAAADSCYLLSFPK